MKFISPWWDRNKVFDRMAKYTHGWRELCNPVRNITVLQHYTLESVSIKISIMGDIISDKAFNCLDTNCCTAVAVRKRYSL